MIFLTETNFKIRSNICMIQLQQKNGVKLDGKKLEGRGGGIRHLMATVMKNFQFFVDPTLKSHPHSAFENTNMSQI